MIDISTNSGYEIAPHLAVDGLALVTSSCIKILVIAKQFLNYVNAVITILQHVSSEMHIH